VPWDLNQAFGNYHGPSCAMNTDDLYELDPFSPTCGGERPLVERMLASEQYRSEYAGQLRDLIEGALYPERTAALARDLHESIREEARQDLLKEFSDTEFEQALEDDIPAGDNPARVPGLLPYMTARDAICREALDRYRSGPDDGK